MEIIKLNAIDSTNAFLKKMAYEQPNLSNFLTIWTPMQTAGVGQYGAKWNSEPNKNLTFSTLCLFNRLETKHFFLLNMLVSLAIHKALETLEIPQLSIKWPNDILSSKYKLGGILIENVIRSGYIEKSIVGIGLNINQTEFNGLPKASSLKKITGLTYEIEPLMQSILKNLEAHLAKVEQLSFESVYPLYKRHLFRINQVSAFRPHSGNDFSGIIRGVLPSGKLVVQNEDDQMLTFSLKEIELLY
ncbi:biotin--[acetyl-CoA-carboxylase] ligase [Capnocytophaga canimorsus]|uniref:biotin--[acetyl-CoA-carboxylase] ligase n=1 Tax=Capnocytophaga canimorsus TaxID=28188 RepID=UPI001AC2E68C|nr:biotin--[acetyl-CoA-carboxylase] ligase [Capnocytophaga canimorsus]GIM58973.1 biotin--[acetyl-CoA-carboxylase] ligase [Capnocytophaga canimorsus]